MRLPDVKRLDKVVAALALAVPSLVQAQTGTPDPALPETEALFARLVAHHQPMYKKFRGINVTTRIESKIVDADTNRVEETSTILNVAQTTWYAAPTNRVLEYSKNGKSLIPEEYEHRGPQDPMYPLFDSEGPKRYRLKVVDRTVMRRRPCYMLEITPRQNSDRHFSGFVYVDAETLDMIYMDGTMADLPFGVQSLNLKFYLKQNGEVTVVDHGTSTVRVKIPLFYDVWFISKMTHVESQPIPRR